MKHIIKTCLVCKNEFKTYICYIKLGRGKYCSWDCYKKSDSFKFKKGYTPKTAFQKGHIPWIKGKKVSYYSPRMTGKTAWNKGLKFPQFSEENHYNWKGNKVSYVGLHMWVYKHLGKPDRCEHCNKSGLKSRFIQWANKSGEYKRELSDWVRLCVKCHIAYDKTNQKVRPMPL